MRAPARLQDAAGWWHGELQTNVTMDAEDMLLREFLGVREASETERSAAWIRSQQRADGTWANFYGGPGELSTHDRGLLGAAPGRRPAPKPSTCAAPPSSSARRAASSSARVFTHLWLALFGLWSWDRVPALPPEIVLLGRRVPLNVYDFACWARQTIVALSLVKAHRPVRPLPFDLDELRCPGRDRPTRAERPPPSRRARWLSRLDRALRCYERTRSGSCGGSRSRAPSAGSSAARRPTARGAESSRRGCTR